MQAREATPKGSTGREAEPLADEARRVFRAEMVRRGVSFKRLAEQLNARGDGPRETVQTLINKVNRGRFSFAFLIRAFRAMGGGSVDFGSRDVAVDGPRGDDEHPPPVSVRDT